MLKKEPEDLIEIEDDHDAGTDTNALRYSDHDQYADNSSSDNDDFELVLYEEYKHCYLYSFIAV